MIARICTLPVLTLALSLKLLLSLNCEAQAQSKVIVTSTNLTSERLVFHESFDPPGDGQPKDSSGAGSRDGLKCSQDELAVQPLMPKRNYGLTLEERPSIFVKLPKTEASQVVLTFQDEARKSYERAFLPINARTGIVSFTLPAEKSPLTVGKNYQWSLVVVCGKTVQPDDPVFTGWVQRVGRSPQMEREMKQKSAIEQAVWYAARGYWYDMIQALVQARQRYPDDAKLSAVWQDLLKIAGISVIKSETFNQ